jgi:hypothetical protein
VDVEAGDGSGRRRGRRSALGRTRSLPRTLLPDLAQLAPQERVLGADHPDTLATRDNLALTHQAGREDRAIGLLICSYSYRHPDSFRTVRYLGLVTARCS